MDDDRTHSALLVIPCYNEEENIAGILNHLASIQETLVNRKNLRFDVLIINDGSTDGTRDILENSCHEAGCSVIHLEKNRGYGYVLRTGFKQAESDNFEWVISFDMDGQHEPKCLFKFIDKIMIDEYQDFGIISGSRYKDPSLFWQNPWKDRFLVNTVITGILNSIGFNLSDSFCGMKAHKVKEINELGLKLDGYEMPIEMLMKAKSQGLKIFELAVPVIYKNRDEVLKTKSTDTFLFKKGGERIQRYISLINQFNDGRDLNPMIPQFQAVFEKQFAKIDEITGENFRQIQSAIYTEINQIINGDKTNNDGTT